MASTRQLKGRIRSVTSTKQITGAMQLVAASKMRKTQDADKASAPYARAASEILTFLAAQGETKYHPLFASRTKISSRLLIVVASDKGLAGAYNSNIFKLYTKELQADDAAGIKNETITIGRRATQFATRLKDVEIIGAYEDLPDTLTGNRLNAILETAKDRFDSGEVDAVDVIYTEFKSAISQTPTMKRVMPIEFQPETVSHDISAATFEPDMEAVVDGLAYRLAGSQIFQAMLDGKASEWSMRMVAMKNATDNASDLIGDLTLAMNKARQGAITQELAEISGGVEALKEG